MAFKDCENDPGYLPASFQGLTFYIESALLTVNPGSATAEFPLRLLPASIDTSKKADDYSFDGWITGPDLNAKIAAFRLAASGPQPFIITHPSHGVLVAGAKSIRFDENYISDSGVCRVSFDGFEWGALPDSSGGFGAGSFFIAAEALLSLASASFLARYSPASTAPYARPQIETTFATASNSVAKAVATVGAPTSVISSDWYNPELAWIALSEPLIEFDDLSEAGAKAMSRLVKELAVSVPPGPAQESIDAIYHSARILAIMALGNTAIAGDYLTPGEVCDARDSVIAPLDAESRAASIRGDTKMMKAIDEYRRSFLTIIVGEISKKPPITSYLFSSTTNSISIAHELYGDASRFKEIERLNPQFLPSQIKGRVFALMS